MENLYEKPEEASSEEQQQNLRRNASPAEAGAPDPAPELSAANQQRKVIFRLNLNFNKNQQDQLEDGQQPTTTTITVHEDDDLEQVAEEFSQAHSLTAEIANRVYQIIRQSYQMHLTKQNANNP